MKLITLMWQSISSKFKTLLQIINKQGHQLVQGLSNVRYK